MTKEDGKRVLVVDDDLVLGTMVGELLNCEGFEPTVFDQSVLAAEALREEKFRVLVTDLRMPQIDGIELIEKATILDPEMGFVLMTGTPQDLNGEIKALKSRGIRIEFLPKPFDIDTLLSMVNKVRQPVEQNWLSMC